MLALLSLLGVASGSSAALAWVLILLSLVAVSGYRIWRIDHPTESARSAVGVRVQGGLAVLWVTVFFLVLGAVPWLWAVFAGVVIVYLVMLVVVYAVANRNP